MDRLIKIIHLMTWIFPLVLMVLMMSVPMRNAPDDAVTASVFAAAMVMLHINIRQWVLARIKK